LQPKGRGFESLPFHPLRPYRPIGRGTSLRAMTVRVRISLWVPSLYPSVAQFGRTRALGARGRRFESCHLDHVWRVRQNGKVAGFSLQCGVFRLRVRLSYTSLSTGYDEVCFFSKKWQTVVQIHLSRPFWHRRQMLSRHTFTVEIADWIPVGVTISECSSVWENTCFGSTGSQVRVLSFRP
jgi:hypothetical protein